MKKYIGFVLTFCCILSFHNISYAYLTDEENRLNQAAPGNNETFIEEEFPLVPPPSIEKDPVYTKVVRVRNAASDKSVPCYVRVRVSVSDSVFKNALKYIGMDQTNWVYSSSDDFYYYKPVLQPGACTTALFEQIQIISAKLEINDAINPSEFVVDVYEESVQAEDFTDYQKAWTYYTTPISK